MSRLMLVGWGSLVLGWGAIAQVAETERRDPSEVAVFTQEAMTQRVQALRPTLERVLGSKLPDGIQVRPTTSHELVPVIVEETMVFLADSREGAAVQRVMRGQAEGLTEALIGKVSPQSRTILINVGALRRSYDLSVAEGPIPAALLDVVLLHEATHVWQDQATALETLHGVCSSLDRFRCRTAVCEGHAQWAMREAAQSLGLEESVAQFDRIVQGKLRLSLGELADLNLGLVLGELIFPYVQGEKWFRGLVEKAGGSGESAFKLAARQPPSFSAQLSGSVDSRSPTQQAIVPGMIIASMKELVAKRGKFRVNSIGLGAVLQQLNDVPSEVKERIAQSLQNFDVGVITEGLFRKKMIVGGILAFADEAGARSYVEANVLIGKARDKKYSDPDGQIFISKSVKKELVLPQGTAGGFDKEVKTRGSSRAQKATTYFMTYGRYVVEVSAFDAGEERAIAVTKLLVQKLADALSAESSGISGVVVHPSGEPVDQARIALRRQSQDAASDKDDVALAVTDESGGFRFCPIEPGSWEIEIIAPEGPEFGQVVHSVVMGDEAQPEIRIELPKRDASALQEVQGDVRFAGSDEVPAKFTRKFWVRDGSEIQLVRVVGSNGQWKAELPKHLEIMEGLIEIDGRLYDDRLGKILSLEPEGLSVELQRFAPPLQLVVKDSDGKPLPSARAWYLPSLEDASSFVPVTADLWEYSYPADSEGQIEIEVGDAGALMIYAKGYKAFTAETRGFDTTKPITLSPGGRLSIMVPDFLPSELDQTIELRIAGGKAIELTLDERTRSLKLFGLPCGTHRIVGFDDSDVARDFEFNVLRDEETQVGFKLGNPVGSPVGSPVK